MTSSKNQANHFIRYQNCSKSFILLSFENEEQGCVAVKIFDSVTQKNFIWSNL